MMNKLSGILLFLFILIFSWLQDARAVQTADIRLTILHVNDMHGQILPRMEKNVDKKYPVGGAEYLARMIEDERVKNPGGTLLFSAGDMFQGSPVSNIFQGKPVIEIMNALKFDAMVLGNHEFDWGFSVLQSLRSEAHFPFLAANITDRKNLPLSGMKPCIILEKKGLKLAVIGVTTPQARYTTRPDLVKDIEVSDPEKILPDMIEKAKNQGARFIIVLSHLGLDEDRLLAEKIPGIHVIVGGHSHTAVTTPVTVGKTLIVQAGSYGSEVGILNLWIDRETGRVLRYTKKGVLKKISAAPGRPYDKKIAKIVRRYSDQIKEEFGRVIGETTTDLTRCPDGETNLGNLVADAMRDATGADMAFQSLGSIRTDIPAGKITMEQAYTVLPFDNVLITMDLRGAQIMTFLERNAVSRRGFIQVSGIKVHYDFNRPEGSKLREALVGGRTIDLEKVYRVTTNDFLAAGGDRCGTFKEGKNIVYGGSLRDAFVAYLEKYSPVHARRDGRIDVTR
jgi:2',3'-cyclic-nucleotide 2'-phosphodiesterase (5'-nucleotidase family)